MEFISSRNNEYIIYCNSLHDKKNRDRDGVFIFEGVKLFHEAIARKVPLVSVIFTEGKKHLAEPLPDSVRKICVTEGVYQKISSEKSPSGVFCIAKAIDKFHKLATIYINNINGSKIILNSLRDPGNLGTVIRTALAFGIDEVILSADCADIYNEKTIRASMGCLFSQKITICPDIVEAVTALKGQGFKVYATALMENSLSLDELCCDEKTVFIIGNEGHGLPDDIISASTSPLIIPMPGGAESLNASVASTILIWEMYKGRKN
ncbi:MAG: RNA methyltransferase [Ruminococcaceae bacterium]|nr:RNA methyltransferase [Oscillospiraceae bacterium]